MCDGDAECDYFRFKVITKFKLTIIYERILRIIERLRKEFAT